MSKSISYVDRNVGAVLNTFTGTPTSLELEKFDETVASERGDARIDFADVKAATKRSLDFIIPRLLPGGKRQGDEWIVRNPTRDDKTARSFSVNMRNGVWSDFATGESGGDMIDLYVYINGGSNIQAKNALAEMLNVQARSGSIAPTPTPPEQSAASLGDFRQPPKEFPPRTPPDEKGKPFFVVAGDEGPPARNDELRRHIYRQGGVAVRIKIIKTSGQNRAINVYRVTGADGVTGWQYKKPEGFQPLPYFVEGADPFTASINQPIFWVEGEKDVDTVAGLGGLAFTFGGIGDGLPEGCRQLVVGRNVVILADNDEPGRKHAQEKAALAAPVAISVKVIHFRELPDKGDISDWIEAGHTFDDLKERVLDAESWQTSAEPGSDPTEATTQLPFGYTFSNRGLMWKDPDDADKPAMHIAGQFDIEAMTRDGDGGSWGLLLRWKDPDGRDHRLALTRVLLAGDGSEARRILTDQGLYIAPSQGARAKFNAFLLQVTSRNRALATDRVGWNGGAFVLPDECFGGDPGETLMLQNATAHEHLFRKAGTLEEWQEIPQLAVGNSRLILAISTAFAGPLLDPCKEEGGGVHLRGSSSIGKTTALHAAGSVWGGNGKNTGFTQTWRATANGLEGVCVNHNDTLLPLDEMAQVTPRDAGEAVYMMTNGAGKTRSRTDGTARRSAKFRVMLLSSGEIALADKIAEDGRGKKMTAGQQVRVVDIPADAGAGLGLFENLHGFESGKALSKHIVTAATTRFYGTAGRAFLTAIMPQIDDIRGQAAEVTTAFCDAYLPKDADGQVGRVAQRFALIAFAGELAIRLGVIRVWEAGTAIAAAGVCFEAWLKERGHKGAAEAYGGVESVRAFLQMHGMARFVDAWGEEEQAAEYEELVRIAKEAGTRPPLPPRPPVPQRDSCGFRRRCSGGWEFYITEAGWTEICSGFNPKTLAATMVEMKALLIDADGVRTKRQERIPGHGKARYYRVVASFLQEQ